ncbi:MAG: fumarylacetoacetate hydrolase family protein [Chloroflexi bacterium]|nr:fumarylacetoacetate hydrolase family protein [Chloroflexota bacterium]
MKVVRFLLDGRPRYGIEEGGTIRPIRGNPYTSFRVGGSTYRLGDGAYELEKAKLLAPCAPSKIVAVGLNYKSHAQETGMALPSYPLIFLKPSTAVIGPEDKILYPEASQRVDYEGELGVVIGKKASRVPKEKAKDYILGYTCFNDVTARDLQKKDGQWSRAKGFDTFAGIGPCIETELEPDNLKLETRLNGELRQSSRTSDLVFSVGELVEYISGIMTLLPGDVISTGTPSGIGPMKPGDVVQVKIEGIGTLRNHVAA